MDKYSFKGGALSGKFGKEKESLIENQENINLSN